MPLASPKSSMSPGELTICEDFLGDHREYAIDLLSNIESVCQWHRTDSCSETRTGRTCTLCDLCSADGLMGTTQKALASYDDAEKSLKTVRTSLGKRASSHGTFLPNILGRRYSTFLSRAGAPARETLFTNSLAKSVFFSIITAGDTLRSQHATWQARLQSDVATSSLLAQSPQFTITGLGNMNLNQNRNGDVFLPTYLGPKVVCPKTNPKLNVVSTAPVTETTNSSMFVVVRRCLSSDCPCELNKENVAPKAKLNGASGSRVTSKVPPSRKTCPSKTTAQSEATTRGGTDFTRSTTMKVERPSRTSTDSSDALAKPKISTHHDPNSPDTRASNAARQNDAVPEAHTPSNPTSETTLSTQETESCSSAPECGALIVDPRVFRLRTQIVQANDARRALMEWCRASRADLQLETWEGHRIGPKALLTYGSAIKGTRGYPFGLVHGLETVDPEKSTSQLGDARTKDLSHGDDEMALEPRCNAQEELRGRWLIARQERSKDRKRRSG